MTPCPGGSEVNQENLERIAQAIESEPEHFKMREWLTGTEKAEHVAQHRCGTAACIGGWVDVLRAKDFFDQHGRWPFRSEDSYSNSYKRLEWLGFEDVESAVATQWWYLTTMNNELVADDGGDEYLMMGRFDDLLPEERAKAGAEVVLRFAKTGRAMWGTVLKELGLYDRVVIR